MNAHTAASTTATGSLVILDKDNAKYSVAGPPSGSGVYQEWTLTDPNPPCPNDVARQIQLGEFASATRIFLCDSDWYTHSEDQRFWMEFMTTRKLTATRLIELEEAYGYQVGQIIAPGLLLVGKWRRGTDNIRDSLSYIRITAPTSPP